jgi:hypothetical protein
MNGFGEQSKFIKAGRRLPQIQISLESGWTYSYVILGPNFEPSVITIPLTAVGFLRSV